VTRMWVILGLLLAAGPVMAQQPDTAGPAPSAEAPAQKHRSGLPFMADEALKRGYELPLPFGAGVILTGLKDRKIDVTDVRVGVEGEPRSVSELATLGSSSNVFNANLRFDTWILPFLNVYAIVGYVHNESDTTIHAQIPRLGAIPGTIVLDKTVDTSLDGVVGGLGTTVAAGYKAFFFVGDFNYVRSDMGFDDAFTARIASLRAGWQGKAWERSFQVWLGVGSWDTAATATGHVDLDDGRTLKFEADQRPHTKWIYDLGTNVMLSRRWQLIFDVGADFNGGYTLVLGPTWRF
jgi:hypothetical protein